MTLDELEEVLRVKLKEDERSLASIAADASVSYQVLIYFNNGGHMRKNGYFERLANFYGYKISIIDLNDMAEAA